MKTKEQQDRAKLLKHLEKVAGLDKNDVGMLRHLWKTNPCIGKLMVFIGVEFNKTEIK